MRTGFDPYIRVGFDGVEPSRVPFADGATVDVEVLARASDGTLRVRVAGKTLVASSPTGYGTASTESAGAAAGYEAGDTFRARVRLSTGAVFLVPLKLPASERADVLSRLSLPDTPEAAFLVRFFARSLYKLDTALCRSLLAVSTRFPGRERRAVEAAAILESHGIRADDDVISRLMDAIEGAPSAGRTDPDGSGGHARDDADRASPGKRASTGEDDVRDDAADGKGDGDDDDADGDGANGAAKGRVRDFVAFINHKKGHDRHWIVIPFSRELAHGRVRGSLRFMIDLASGRCLETLMTVQDGERLWDFDLFGERCEFRTNPPFSPVKNGEIAVYLRGILESMGYTETYATDFSSDSSRDMPAIDLEA